VVKATFNALKQMRDPEVELAKRRQLVEAVKEREQRILNQRRQPRPQTS
jgi:hypothetical protein